MQRLLALAFALLTAAGCSSGDDDGSSSDSSVDATVVAGISEDEAVEIAIDAIADNDPNFDFDATYHVVVDHGDRYEVAFPERNVEGYGGEPHVFVDKESGEASEIFHTL